MTARTVEDVARAAMFDAPHLDWEPCRDCGHAGHCWAVGACTPEGRETREAATETAPPAPRAWGTAL